MLQASAPPEPSVRPAHPELHVRVLGRVPYADALAEQRRLHAERVEDRIPDTLLLLEHPHVYTLGRNSDPQHILMPEEYLRSRGATVERNERGGEVTYHGPGQLVAYPIIKLQQHERSITQLVWRLEETILRTLAEFGLQGRREAVERGVWIGDRKVASIGMSLRRWVVMHGMALNVAPDLAYFQYINPCGHPSLAMTSMALELAAAPSLYEAGAAFTRHFEAVFERDRR